MTTLAQQYAMDVIDSLSNDPSVAQIGLNKGMKPIRRSRIFVKSKQTSMELAKQTSSNKLPLTSIRHLEGFTVQVRQRNGRIHTGKLFFESGQCVVRNGQHVLTNFHYTNKTQINTRTYKIIA